MTDDRVPISTRVKPSLVDRLDHAATGGLYPIQKRHIIERGLDMALREIENARAPNPPSDPPPPQTGRQRDAEASAEWLEGMLQNAMTLHGHRTAKTEQLIHELSKTHRLIKVACLLIAAGVAYVAFRPQAVEGVSWMLSRL